MWLKCTTLYITLIFLGATMCYAYTDHVNQVSSSMDTSKSNLLKNEFSNVNELKSSNAYLDVRRNNLLQQHRRRRKIRNGKFIHKRERQKLNSIHPININQRHISGYKTPLLMQNEQVVNAILNLPSQNNVLQPEMGGTQFDKEIIQNPSRKFLETQIAKKSLNPLQEVPSQETKLSMNEQQKNEPCTNKQGCKQKSHLAKREYFTDLQSGFAGNDYEFVPKPKGKDNIIINVKEDAFKDISDKNSTALLQEIVEQLHEIRASESVSQGLNCILYGHWKSQIGGMALNITGPNDTSLQNCSQSNSTQQNITGPLVVNLYDNTKQISPIKHPVLNSNWTLAGHVPHVVNGTLILNAENKFNKHVAVYIGQCRICEGAEIITGQWLIHYNVKDCRNMEASQMIRGDVFKRIQLKSEETHKG